MTYTPINEATTALNPSDMDTRVDQDDLLSEEFSTSASMVNSLNNSLKNAGYQLFPSPENKDTGFQIYAARKPEVPGLEMPGVKIWRKAKADDNKMAAKYISQWFSTHMAALREDEEENASKMKTLNSFYHNLTNCNQMRNPLLAVSGRMIEQGEGLTPEVTRRNMGYPKCRTTRVLPTVNTVVELDIDPRELLHVFPEAEQTFFMWSIGRIMCGRQGSERIYPDGNVKAENTVWRGWSLLQSAEGGIGKSTFCKTLLTHIEEMGYRVASINIKGKFDWLQTALADVAFKDDFNNQEQGIFIKDENVKIIASNGVMSTEGKGERRLDNIQTEAFILGCTNTANQAHFFNVDNGTLTRSNILSAKTSVELGEGNENIVRRWNEVAFRVGTQTAVLPGQFDEYGEPIPTELPMCPILMTWFIAQCATKYMLDQPSMTKQTPVRSEFRTKSEVTSSTEIAMGLMQCTAAQLHLYERVEGAKVSNDEKIAYFKRMQTSFSTKKVLVIINIAATTGAIVLPSLDVGILNSFRGTGLADKIQNYGNDGKTSMTRLFNDLRTIEGNSYAPAAYQYMCHFDIAKVIQIYDEMTKNPEKVNGFKCMTKASTISDAFEVHSAE